MNLRSCVAAAVLLHASFSAAVTVSVDTNTTYQTIEGLGAFAEVASAYTPGHVQFLHDDLGLSMLRIFIEYDIERTNDNADPNNTDLTKFALPQRAITQINAMKQFPDVKFIGSLWSPPAWMKTNNSTDNGGNLRDNMREELAEMLYAWVTLVKQQTGVDVFAVSIQNESAFEEPYASCVYSATQYRDAFKTVGAYLAAKGLTTKFFGAEHMAWALNNSGTYEKVIKADPAASPYLYAMAVHGYQDGVQADTGSFAGVSADDKQLWMTETSGYPLDWNGAMSLAANIHQSLRLAKMSAWVWWALEGKNDGERLLTAGLDHTKKSLVSKNFYKWVRPGALMVGCTSGAASLLASAYVQRADRTMTIVLVNSAGATTVSLSGTAIPASFEKHVTSSSKNCADEGTVASSGSITIDGSSVTTLFAREFGPVRAVEPLRMLRPATHRTGPAGGPVGLDGRWLEPATAVRPLSPAAAVTNRVNVTVR